MSDNSTLQHKASRIWDGFKKVIRQPTRLFEPITWQQLIHLNLYLSQVDYTSSGSWFEDTENNGLKRKHYLSYQDYLQHQKSKLTVKGTGYLSEYEVLFHDALLQRLQILDDIVSFHGKSVLCLAARLGTEVRAFIDMYCFAIGLDLNPGPENKYVVFGDFHNIQFAPDSVDIIYTNSFDHVLDEYRVIAEMIRLLHKGGYLLLELPSPKDGKQEFGTYESLYWSDPGEIVRMFAAKGFQALDSKPIDYPWQGTYILFRLSEKE